MTRSRRSARCCSPAAPGRGLEGGDGLRRGRLLRPEKVAIGQGEKVKWTNDGSNDHTVKFKGEKNKVFGPGESVSARSSRRPGKFQYHCTLHAGMDGKVVAKDVR